MATRSPSVMPAQTETSRKCAVEDPDLIARRECGRLSNARSRIVLAARSAADHRIGYRHRAVAVADKPRHADRRLDRAPALAAGVDFDKEIAGKQRRGDFIDAARMPPALAIARQIGGKALPGEMCDRLGLGVGVGLRHVPSRLAWRHFDDSRFCACGRSAGPAPARVPRRSVATAASQRLHRLEQIGHQHGVARGGNRVVVFKHRQSDESRLCGAHLHDARDLDPALERADGGDFRKVGTTDERTSSSRARVPP